MFMDVEIKGSMEQTKGTEAVEAVHGSTTDNEDPWEAPFLPFPPVPPTMDRSSFSKMVHEHLMQTYAEKRSTAIISPDRTPQCVFARFAEINNCLETILRKDSVPCFLRLFKRKMAAMVYGYVITPQTLDAIVACNALCCADAVLKGLPPKLGKYRANPNYMTYLGYFPIHQAAEAFSVDMIELLLHYNASANLRTSGKEIIEGLLPLHVAIENTCLHKYLEDNLFTDQKHNHDCIDVVPKLIHLLCLPEMKIFLDTVRLLANYTDGVVEELKNYIKDGKFVHTAILLFAAQRLFCNLGELGTIKDFITDSMVYLETEGHGLASGKNSKAHKQLKERRAFFRHALVLVSIITKVGEELDTYIQTYSEVSHQEVLGTVSSILQAGGFAPSDNIGKLVCLPYDCEVPDNWKPHGSGDIDVAKAAMGSPNLNVEAISDTSTELRRRLELEYARNLVFPYWRSALKCKSLVKVYPSYAPFERMPVIEQLGAGSQYKFKSEGYFPIRLDLLGRSTQPSNFQSRRLFGTAAFTLLKMLKRA